MFTRPCTLKTRQVAPAGLNPDWRHISLLSGFAQLGCYSGEGGLQLSTVVRASSRVAAGVLPHDAEEDISDQPQFDQSDDEPSLG